MALAMALQDNRYAPPKALELELAPEAPMGPCIHVEWARKLIWAGFGVSVLSSTLLILTNHDPRSRGPLWFSAVLGLGIGFPLMFWVTTRLRAGRNWMRLLVTIFSGIGIAMVALSLAMLLATEYGRSFLSGFIGVAPIPSLSMLLHTLLGVPEVILLNTSRSRAWFAAKKISR